MSNEVRSSAQAIGRFGNRTARDRLSFSRAIGASLLVVAACGGSTSPEEIATSFMEARDAWDVESTEALLAPDAAVNDLEVPRHADYQAQYRWYEALDWRWNVGDCVQVGSESPTTVSCTYTMENAWSRSLGVAPIDGRIEFGIEGDQISSVDHGGFNIVDFGPVWDAFRTWVFANHRDDVDLIYASGSHTPVYTPEAATLWEQLTDEYVAAGGS